MTETGKEEMLLTDVEKAKEERIQYLRDNIKWHKLQLLNAKRELLAWGENI